MARPLEATTRLQLLELQKTAHRYDLPLHLVLPRTYLRGEEIEDDQIKSHLRIPVAPVGNCAQLKE